MENFKKNLLFLRKKSDKSQNEFAEMLGIKRTTYASYESGASSPEFKSIFQISDLLGVSAGDLIDRDLENITKSMPTVNEPLTEYTKTTDKDLLIASLQKNIVLLENCAALLEEKLRLSENALKEAEYKLLDQQAEISELQNRKQAG